MTIVIVMITIVMIRMIMVITVVLQCWRWQMRWSYIRGGGRFRQPETGRNNFTSRNWGGAWWWCSPLVIFQFQLISVKSVVERNVWNPRYPWNLWPWRGEGWYAPLAFLNTTSVPAYLGRCEFELSKIIVLQIISDADMDVKSIFGKFVRKSWKGLQGTTIGTNFFSRVFFKETSRVDWETEPEKWTCFIIRRHIEDNVWKIHLAGRRADQETGNGSHWPENGRRRPMREQQQPDGGPIFPPIIESWEKDKEDDDVRGIFFIVLSQKGDGAHHHCVR